MVNQAGSAKVWVKRAVWVGIAIMFAITSTLGYSASPDKTLSYAMQGEPPNLNSMKSTDQDSFFVLGHLMEGLARVGKSGQDEPGVAESWKLTDKGVTFKLRKAAKWSDGKPVTAKDFVFAWRTALDPKMASEYAFLLYSIKNAEKINKGKAAGIELGAEAVDDTTLKVTFELPTAYFVSLTAMPIYFPIREDVYAKHQDRYAADAQNMVFNGPFMLTKWVHGSELQMDKNAQYWNSGRIKLERIAIPYMTPDNSAKFNFFKDKKIDVYERFNKEDLEKARRERFKISSYTDGSIWFMEFNMRKGRITTNANLRKAIRAVYSPDGEYVNSVVGIPGTKAGRGFIPQWVRGKSDLFRKEFPIAVRKPNIEEGKKYLALAMKELGLSTPPALTWLTGDTPFTAHEAEYFQNLFKKSLGITLKIDRQTFKQRLAKMTSGDFDIVAAGWGPDYADVMTFADLKASWNENNRGRWENAEYDRLIKVAMGTTDAKKRMEAVAAAEKILLDDVGVILTYERQVAFMVQPWVQGVVRRAVGYDPDFTGVVIGKRP